VHGEQLVEHLGAEEVVVGHHELRAHQQGHQPAEHQEEERREDEAAADGLVVALAEPADEARPLVPQLRRAARGRGGLGRGLVAHSRPSR
jgi:hypothetical protein